jgi:hypothetical protein
MVREDINEGRLVDGKGGGCEGRLVDGKGGGGGKGLLYAGEELEWSVPLAQGELYRGEGGQGLPPTAPPYCNMQ